MNSTNPDTNNEVATTKTTMTPQEINLRIAIACGWDRFCTYEVNGKIVNYGHPPNDDKYYESPIPNYYEDLNAMHDAEAQMKDYTFFSAYDHILKQIMGGETKVTWLFHATASQRAEAFLRTIGQWEETK